MREIRRAPVAPSSMTRLSSRTASSWRPRSPSTRPCRSRASTWPAIDQRFAEITFGARQLYLPGAECRAPRLASVSESEPACMKGDASRSCRAPLQNSSTPSFGNICNARMR